VLILGILKDNDHINSKAPEKFRVFPKGEVRIKDQAPAIFDDESAQLIIDEFKNQRHDMVVDYEHQTLSGDQAPAAGWVTNITYDNNGLWVHVKWTDKAKEYIESKEYRYFSPVCQIRKKDRKITALYNVALTNQPRLNDLPPLVAKFKEGDQMKEQIIELLGLAPESSDDDVIAAVSALMQAGLLEKLQKLMELPDAGEEAVIDAVAQMLENPMTEDAFKKLSDILGLKDAKADDLIVAVAKLKDSKKTVLSFAKPDKSGDVSSEVTALTQALGKEIESMRDELAQLKSDKMVDQAVAEGKVTPDELKGWASDLSKNNPDLFKKVILSRERGSAVPIDDLPGKTKATEEKETLEAKQAVENIGAMMGVSDEDRQKYGDK